MWIYSLGITLRRTIQSTANNQHQRKGISESGIGLMQNQQMTIGNYQNDVVVQATARKPITNTTTMTTNHQHHGHHFGQDNDTGLITNNAHKHLTSLDYVVRMMCAPNLHYRASLMYLLDVSYLLCIFLIPSFLW